MRYLVKVIEIIFNPLFCIITANENVNNNSNKGFLVKIKKHRWILLLLAALITAGIILCCYHKEIFGV